MKHILLTRFSLFFILFSLIVSCQPEKYVRDDTKKLYIVATTGMIGDVVKNVVGDLAKVEFLMGPGVDPHLYKATKSDLDKIREADIIFYNGLHLEARMADVLDKLSNKKPVYAVADAIPKGKIRNMDGDENSIDPHIWLDVEIWMKATELIAAKMAEQDSKNAEVYEKNAKQYIVKLEELHQKTKKEIASISKEQRVLITAHDALGYFGRAYNIEVKGLQGISTATEFGLKDVSDLVDFIVKRKIKAVFVETFISAKSINAVVEGCRQKGHTVKIGGTLFTDALGAEGTPEGTYIGMLEANLKTIINSLK